MLSTVARVGPLGQPPHPRPARIPFRAFSRPGLVKVLLISQSPFHKSDVSPWCSTPAIGPSLLDSPPAIHRGAYAADSQRRLATPVREGNQGAVGVSDMRARWRSRAERLARTGQRRLKHATA